MEHFYVRDDPRVTAPFLLSQSADQNLLVRMMSARSRKMRRTYANENDRLRSDRRDLRSKKDETMFLSQLFGRNIREILVHALFSSLFVDIYFLATNVDKKVCKLPQVGVLVLS